MDERVSKAKLTERLLTRPGGATMRDVIAATGGPQYNELKRLAARGYSIRKVKEGNETRYFARGPDAPTFDATVSGKGQVTLPKEVRERLGVRPGRKVRFSIDKDGSVAVSARPSSIQESFGMLGRPPRSATLEQMDEGIRRAVVDKYLRAVGRKH